MSVIDVEPTIETIPPWIHDMKFCHLYTFLNGKEMYFCGAPIEDGPDCGDYLGESICSTCNRPTCPCCAQLAALEDAFWGAS